MSQSSYVRLRIRRDTAANWTQYNPVLKVGEPGLETDTRRLKFGDGATPWNGLQYAGADISEAVLSENIDDRVASLLVAGSGITLNYNDNSNELIIGATGGDTGDISFSGIKIIGAGTASGDGNNKGTLELVPDNTLYNNDQYLIVDPTVPNHIHLRAGGAIDDSNAELILGGEKAQVKILDFNHEVKIQSGSGQTTGSFNFTAVANGVAEITDYSIVPPVGAKFTINEIEYTMQSAVETTVNNITWVDATFSPQDQPTAGTYNWTFGSPIQQWNFNNDGNLVIPGNILFPDGSVQSTASSKNSVGLSNVDNTSDLNKPVSTAVQTALNSKLAESTDRYIVCKSGDDILSKYATAKLLTPGGNALSSNNRAYLIVMPGVYPLSAQWEIDAEFVDVIGLGSSPLDRGCNVSVTVTGNDINVSANNVRIKGIGTTSNGAFRIDGDKPLQVFEECKGGNFSFGAYDTASGTFINCIGGSGAFGGGPVGGGIASGTFINCVGGDTSFGGGPGGIASGTFVNCSGGPSSFGNYGTASGTFKDCSGGDNSFGGYGTASGTFTNCSGGNQSFGGGDTASGIFKDCSGGDYSFGGTDYGIASGSFINCSGGHYSFGGTDTGGGTASGTFTNCSGGNQSFGGYGTASGTFTNCSGGASSFGGGDTANGTFLRCTLTFGTFQTLSGNGKYRLCIDGNYDVINADAPPPPPPPPTPRTLYFNAAVDNDWQTLGNWWNDAGFTSPATSLPTSVDSVFVYASITNTGSEPTVANLTVTDASFDMNITVTGAAIVEGSLSGAGLASGRTLTGNATFEGDPFAPAYAFNYGTVAGNATFVGNASNDGTVTGNATFTGDYNADAWAVNSGTVTGNATFNTNSRNNGTVAGTATFNDSACNDGTGTAGTFVPDPPPSCE